MRDSRANLVAGRASFLLGRDRRHSSKEGKVRPGMLAAALACAASTAACGTLVTWEEEVPLNVGQVIVAKREVRFSNRGAPGNPLDVAPRPERNRTLEFEWQGKRYRYDGDAIVMLLAIAPGGSPVLVAKAADNSWDAVHRYACTLPYYVQLQPDAGGRSWNWPPAIEPWLYDLPANLMLNIPGPQEAKARYSAAEREMRYRFATAKMSSSRRVDPTYTGDLCDPRRR